MIDGESSKAELLQKVFIWRYYCSYSDAYVIKTSEIRQQKDTECVYNYTKQGFTGWTTLNYHSDATGVKQV